MKVCATEPCSELLRFLPSAGFKSGTAESTGQSLTLKVPIPTAADDIYNYLIIIFQRKLDLIFHVNPLLGRGFT